VKKVSNKTLIAYVTKGGATEESGYIIAETLRDKHGLQVDLVNLKKNSAPDLSQYGNVIVGSGVRIGRVYKEALRFLEKDFGDKKKCHFSFHPLKLAI
jgi:menaquinone-dependent protoporphyrinogen IX oxidase